MGCAQEVDPNPENARLTAGDDEGSFLADLAASIPGIDEAMSFAEVMRQVSMDCSTRGQLCFVACKILALLYKP